VTVRLRFAPSPTGWLHVGGARTAYFNLLFARQRGGAYVLRVEDTDVVRSSAASEAGVLDDLAWLGLDHDEGPDRGGPFGPYRQSERLDLYRGHAERLVSDGKAYPCFCTDAELEERRQAALAAGHPPQYDRRCRALTAEERDARRREGRPESVRFAVPPRDWVLDDLVRGEVRFPHGVVGDFVLLRSNGLPTYNFAASVDDAAMKITHVIRAEEHLANTPRQLMIYDALGEKPPAFAHVPLILNPDRSKMSKRQGEAAVAVGDWRRAGYVPDAMLSYLAFLGFHPGDEREILTRAELLEAFSIDRVGKSGAVFDPQKLRWVNSHFLHHADGAQILSWIDQAHRPKPTGEPEPEWRVAWRRMTEAAIQAAQVKLLEVVRGNLATLADLPAELSFLGEELPMADTEEAREARRLFDDEGARELCRTLSEELGELAEWSAERFKSALLAAGKRNDRSGRALFQPVRAALTGRLHGPELPTLAELLGRDRCVARLMAAASREEGSS
jgi:nondiscriminating glutamyl-tRNA synthetase